MDARRGSLGLISALALSVSICLPALAHAQARTPDEDLAAIRELVLRATYRDALTQTTTFLTRTDLDAAHRNAGLETLGIVQLALRDESGAAHTLAELYARDPGHRLDDPDASPVVQTAFARAREAAAPATVELVDTTAAPTTHVTPVVSVRLGEHGDTVQEMRVSYRREGAPAWSTLVLSPDASGTAQSPLAIAGVGRDAYAIEYHVEAFAPSNTILARLGSADAPVRLEVPALASDQSLESVMDTGAPAPSGGGVETEAWFWIVIGVVVVGAGVGIGLGVGLSQPSARDGSLGNATLPLVAF